MYAKDLVKIILEHPLGFNWSAQGLGMLRVYLCPEIRLHIWDRSLLAPGVSPVHTHPWDFHSLIIVGELNNQRFEEDPLGEPWQKVTIKCGENACSTSEPQLVHLQAKQVERYPTGTVYEQRADEIHRSLPEDGTVTIIRRRPLADPDHAAVYWRGKGLWVDAKPRAATENEILSVTKRTLDCWF